MKILFLTRFFYPHIGGVEKHVMEMSKRLVKMGHEVTVVSEEETGGNSSTSGESHSPIPSPSEESLRATSEVFPWLVYKIPVGKDNWFKKFRIWSWLWQHRQLIKESDIVHAHDVGFWYFPFRFLYPKKPFFITFHGYEQYPPSKKQILVRKISEKLARGNICVGDYIPKWYGTKADFITYGAVVIPPPRRSAFAHLRGVFNSEVSLPLVFIGRLDEQTGIMTYLETFKSLRSTIFSLQLDILGDGPLRNKAEDFIRRNRLNARILGFVKDPEKYLAVARFAFVSRYLAILEAMAAKKLVFAVYDNPLKEDYLKLAPFSQWIIIENNPEALSNKLMYYLQHSEEEKRLVDKGFQWVKEQTWEKMVGLYLTLWR